MNNTGVKIVVLSILLPLLPAVSFAAQQGFEDKYTISIVNMEDGMPGNYIDDLYVDSAGFLWISTAGGGLCRYDGSETLGFSFSSNPPLKSTFVRNVTEDRFNRLWIASEGGLDIWDLRELRQASITLPFPSREENPCCSFVTQDTKGVIWTKFGDTIYRIPFEKDGTPGAIGTFSHPGISRINYVFKDVDRDGSVWAVVEGRLHKISPDFEGELTVQPIPTDLDLGPGTYVSDYLAVDSQVWISTEHGLYVLYKVSGQWKHYQTEAGNPHSLTQDFVTSLARTSDGQLLASTLHGLNIYNPLSDDFEQCGEDVINMILPYEDGFLMATENAGWQMWSNRQLNIRELGARDQLASGLVNAIWEDASGRLWVGVVEGGLNIREPGETYFTHMNREKGGLAHNSVSALRSGPRGEIYVGTWGSGVDIVSGEKPHRVTDHLPDEASLLDYVGILEYDERNQLLWIGSNTGIYHYSSATRQYIQATKERVTGCIGSCIDRQGRLWMGCQQGVYIFDLNTRKEDGAFSYKHYRHKLDMPFSQVDDKICCVAEGPDGTIWLGSNGGGVYRACPENDGWRFVSYSSAQGLSSGQVRGISVDGDGFVWISTERGLNRLSPESGSIVSFFRSDGLESDVFHWNNAFRSPGGLLYFGHAQGVSVLDPSSFTEDAFSGPLRFTMIRVGDREYRDPFLQELRLHERDRAIAFHFSILGMHHRQMHYEYRLEGFETEWQSLQEGRQDVTYASLPAGDYCFQVVAIDPFGKKLGELSLPVNVRSYFHHTWWFSVLMIFLLLLIAWYILFLRTRTLRRQQELLEQTVQERTREISAQKKLVEAKAEELHRQNEILYRQNEELASRKLLFAPERRAGADPREDEFMERALSTLRQHYKNPDLDVNVFCQAMGVSKTLLNSKLQESFGQSIGHFIRTYRLAVAREMLESGSGVTVSEVAYEVGFNDPKYFTRCFSKEFGITPSTMGK